MCIRDRSDTTPPPPRVNFRYATVVYKLLQKAEIKEIIINKVKATHEILKTIYNELDGSDKNNG